MTGRPGGCKVSVGGCGCILLVLALNLTPGAMATHYCIDHWLHKEASWLICMLIGLFGGEEVLIPASIITWLLVLGGVIQ